MRGNKLYNYTHFSLVLKVTTLVKQSKNNEIPKRGRSKKATLLVKDIGQATVSLIEVGESIANDFPEVKTLMLEACKAASTAGLLYCNYL